MATRYLNMSGKIKWANTQYGGLFEPDPNYGTYKISFYPDNSEWDKFKKSGLKLETKSDDDGDYIVFRRPHEKVIKGEMQTLGRPKVYFAKEIEDKATRNIGNLSSANINVAVYGERPYVGHRLEAVTVTDLVEYTGGGNRNDGVEFKDGKNDPVERQRDDTNTKDENLEPPFDDGVPFGKDSDEEVKTVKPAVRKPTPFKR